MWDDLRPLTLTEAAHRLGVDPFEVMRLLVATDAVPPGPPFVSGEIVDQLRQRGQIDGSWWDGASWPDDPQPGRRLIRSALGQLVERGHIGDSVTRLDNLTRGRSAEEQRLLVTAVRHLAEERLLHVHVRPIGIMVSIAADALESVHAIVEGNEIPAPLTSLLEG